MSTNKKTVLIIGPGFIGWNVLDILVAEGYRVTGFVRRREHGEDIKASGANNVVLGDLDDKKLITAEVLKHDIIFHTATADHLPSVEAVLDGLRNRAEEGKESIFVHTSGTSVLEDNSMVGHVLVTEA
jgi:nucleoside-diphosphate-sugar epimerase